MVYRASEKKCITHCILCLRSSSASTGKSDPSKTPKSDSLASNLICLSLCDSILHAGNHETSNTFLFPEDDTQVVLLVQGCIKNLRNHA